MSVENPSNETGTLGEVARAYRGCRERVTELVTDLDEQGARHTVPACPNWTVHDVLAHLSGGVADALAGRMEGAGTDPWTAAQVRERADHPLVAILDEWNSNAPQVEPLMDAAGEVGRQAVADVATHEHDIRGALARPGARDSDAILIGLGFGAEQLITSAAARGISMRVQAMEGVSFGSDEPSVTLIGDTFELFRAIHGRRSVDQIRDMKWEGDAEEAIPAFWWLSLHPSEAPIYE
jgi:uncharacterized protein (TIGR03083 family)